MNREQLGQAAFNAYGDAVGWRTHGGAEMPTWTQVGERIREAWSRAAEVVASRAMASTLEATQARPLPPGHIPSTAGVPTPTVGRLVHYVLGHEAGNRAGELRPALVVAVRAGGLPNLQVFTDGGNDLEWTGSVPCVWRGSVPHGGPGQLGTWFWPPRA